MFIFHDNAGIVDLLAVADGDIEFKSVSAEEGNVKIRNSGVYFRRKHFRFILINESIEGKAVYVGTILESAFNADIFAVKVHGIHFKGNIFGRTDKSIVDAEGEFTVEGMENGGAVMGEINFFHGISEKDHIDIGKKFLVVIFDSEQTERKFTLQTACRTEIRIQDNAVIDIGKGFSDGREKVFGIVFIKDIFVSVILIE